VRLLDEEGYGFISADDGREIYFHRNAVLDNGFATLRPGAEVHFAEEEGENGPQASSVRAFGPGSRKPARLASTKEDRP
jgi:cold shock CspA family protein